MVAEWAGWRVGMVGVEGRKAGGPNRKQYVRLGKQVGMESRVAFSHASFLMPADCAESHKVQ